MQEKSAGVQMYNLVKDLFPICRSITGDGVRQTLKIISQHLPALKIHEIPTGQRCFDWVIPQEWNIKDAYVKNESGEKIIDFHESNLHIVNYSIPVDKDLDLKELDQHLHSLPQQPDAIPYVTSYFDPSWGFCITENKRNQLKDGIYSVKVDSSIEDGSLSYADLLIKGESEKEILISTYICHPSMANNELSGPVLATFLAKWILSQKNRRYSYRIIFVPETIGAIAYLSYHMGEMKKKTVAGFVLTCVGDDRSYSYMPSRKGGTLADHAALHVLTNKISDFESYSFLNRGSDERQFCAPGVDLPVCSMMRTKYGEFPEYHTSYDDLTLVSPEGFQGSFDIHTDLIRVLEANDKYVTTVFGEPQLGKRNLRQAGGAGKGLSANYQLISNFLAYADGDSSLIDIADALGVYALDLLPVIDQLKAQNLIKLVDEPE